MADKHLYIYQKDDQKLQILSQGNNAHVTDLKYRVTRPNK